MPMYRHEARVILKGAAFPLDMLRYDTCFPAHSVDAETILASQNGGYPDRTVCVIQYTETKASRWTPERWRSFGIEIEPGLTERR